MEEDDAVEALERLGLTGYEARTFIALQKLGVGTARDVSSVADVPRSQVYSTAENLAERGLVEIQQASPMEYRPVSIEEARETLRSRFERESDRAFDYVESVRSEYRDASEEQEDIWTVRGRDRIDDRTETLVRDATTSVVYAARVPAVVPGAVREVLRERAAAGIDVTVVSESAAVRDLFADDEAVRVLTPAKPEQTPDPSGRAVFVDTDTVLLSVLGECDDAESETAFWSAGTNFATMLIRLIEASGAVRGL